MSNDEVETCSKAKPECQSMGVAAKSSFAQLSPVRICLGGKVQPAKRKIRSKVVIKGKDRNRANDSNSKECIQLKMLRIASDVPTKGGMEVEEIPARWKEEEGNMRPGDD